jgi:hypothetical protein
MGGGGSKFAISQSQNFAAFDNAGTYADSLSTILVLDMKPLKSRSSLVLFFSQAAGQVVILRILWQIFFVQNDFFRFPQNFFSSARKRRKSNPGRRRKTICFKTKL